MYLGDVTKNNNIAKQSPGPVYRFEDEIKYQKLPAWGLGTAERMGKDKPRYDFYENNMFLDDPMAADLTRKGRCAAPKIGTEPRMAGSNLEQVPGPQYLPGAKPEL